MIARLLRGIADRLLANPLPTEGKGERTWGAYVIPNADGSRYMTRILLPRVLGVRAMVQEIHTADDDRDPHNHPWEWCFSIILSGGYVEERREGALGEEVMWLRRRPGLGILRMSSETRRRCRTWNWIGENTYHRIVHLTKVEPTWTLFVGGARRPGGWGFLLIDAARRAIGFEQSESYLAKKRAASRVRHG